MSVTNGLVGVGPTVTWARCVESEDEWLDGDLLYILVTTSGIANDFTQSTITVTI